MVELFFSQTNPARIASPKLLTTNPADLSKMEFLKHFSPLPAQTALLGVCEDGFPVLFDLLDERPGALLVVGQPDSGKTTLCKLIVTSLSKNNDFHAARYAVITSHPQEWADFTKTDQETGMCLAVENAADETAGDLILHLAERAEQRHDGHRMGAPVILFVDSLEFIAKVDSDIRLNFEWLIQNGARAQIWVVASLRAELMLSMGRLVNQFPTLLVGAMSQEAARRLSGLDQVQPHQFIAGRQFAARINRTWRAFWLPVME